MSPRTRSRRVSDSTDARRQTRQAAHLAALTAQLSNHSDDEYSTDSEVEVQVDLGQVEQAHEAELSDAEPLSSQYRKSLSMTNLAERAELLSDTMYVHVRSRARAATAPNSQHTSPSSQKSQNSSSESELQTPFEILRPIAQLPAEQVLNAVRTAARNARRKRHLCAVDENQSNSNTRRPGRPRGPVAEPTAFDVAPIPIRSNYYDAWRLPVTHPTDVTQLMAQNNTPPELPLPLGWTFEKMRMTLMMSNEFQSIEFMPRSNPTPFHLLAKAQDLQGRTVFLKIFSIHSPAALYESGILHEMTMQRVPGVPRWLALKDFHDFTVIFMEYVGPILPLPHHFPSLMQYALQWLQALCELHGAGWAHGRILPQHLLFNEKCFLVDFSRARLLTTAPNPQLATPNRPPPNSKSSSVDQNDLDESDPVWRVDMYQLGLLLTQQAERVLGANKAIYVKRFRKWCKWLLESTPRERPTAWQAMEWLKTRVSWWAEATLDVQMQAKQVERLVESAVKTTPVPVRRGNFPTVISSRPSFSFDVAYQAALQAARENTVEVQHQPVAAAVPQQEPVQLSTELPSSMLSSSNLDELLPLMGNVNGLFAGELQNPCTFTMLSSQEDLPDQENSS